MKKLTARFIKAFVSVRAKIITLCLEKIGRQPLVAIRVVKGQGSAERRHGNAFLRRRGDDIPQRLLRTFDRGAEEGIEQQIKQLRIVIKSLFYFAEEHTSDDASAAPH